MSVLRVSTVAALALALTAGSAMAAPKWTRPGADAQTAKSDKRMCRKISGRLSTGQMGVSRMARLPVYVPNQGVSWEVQSADVNSMAGQGRYRNAFMAELGRARLEEAYFVQCMGQLGYSPAQAD
jgi:hypothetical protein